MGSGPVGAGGASSPDAGKSSVTNKNADDHFAYVRWDEASLGALTEITPKEGEKVQTADEQLRGMVKVSPWNPALTLLYFHTPHEGLEKSKLVGAAGATFRQCKTFHDEQVVRWLLLYHCVEVDMGASDAKTAERLGLKDDAMFVVVDQDLNVVGSSKAIATSEGVAAFLKTTFKSPGAAKYWSMVQTQIDEQKKSLDKARALVTKDKFKEALEQYDLVLASKVHVADFWDDACKEAVKAARKAEQEK